MKRKQLAETVQAESVLIAEPLKESRLIREYSRCIHYDYFYGLIDEDEQEKRSQAMFNFEVGRLSIQKLEATFT